MPERKRLEAAFSVPLLPVAALGTLACGGIYFLILLPPLRNALVIRYALCHWVAVASAWLFCIAIATLIHKVRAVRRQNGLTAQAGEVLQGIVDSKNDLDSRLVRDGVQLSLWMDTLWRSQKTAYLNSWMGQRLSEFIARQIKRGSIKRLDEDLLALSERDADAQHDSHGMIRIICWAMPMLGFLGTVIGISDTLGKMDAQALASGSQEAMNGLTAGLYVAFDTTAIGLVLTMITMFVQFPIQRTEMRLLSRIDESISGAIHESLSVPDHAPDTSDVQASLRAITHGLLDSVQQLVQKQSELWRDTISEAHSQWLHLSDGVTEATKAGLVVAIRESLDEYRQAMQVQSRELVQLQADGAQQIDARLQQWQITISEQARLAHRQQQEMSRNAELLQQLLDSSQLVGAMQGPIESTLNRLTDVDRFHDAAVCLAEAVAVLGTQMERYGYLGRQPVRRRGPDNESGNAEATSDEESSDVMAHERVEGKSASLWKRKAG